MQRVPLRQLSGRVIQAAAEDGHPLVITNDNVVCGVMQPIDTRRVQEFVDDSLSRISHSINLAEASLDRGDVMATLDAAFDEAGGHRLADRLVTANGETSSDDTPVRRLAIRDLSGDELEDAAQSGERVALTNRNVLCAVIEPVSVDWVETLIEQNLSRLATSVQRAEKDLELGTRLSTLDEVVGNSTLA